MKSGGPSRSCVSAGCTSPASSKPAVSVTTCPLAAFDFLCHIEAAWAARLVVLTVSINTGQRAWLASGRFTRLQQQFKIDPLQHAVVAPSIEVNAARWHRVKT